MASNRILLKNNLYNQYIYNIYILIKKYKLKYSWIDLSEEKFYQGIMNCDYGDFNKSYQNFWIDKYSNNHLGLAEDILTNGMFTPIFYQKINNKKYIVAGKHRFYSLYFYNSITPINKKFLFIEYPNEENPCNFPKYKLYNFLNFEDYEEVIPTNYIQIFNLLVLTGDILSLYLKEYSIQPNKIFQNEEYFNNFLEQYEKEEYYAALRLD